MSLPYVLPGRVSLNFIETSVETEVDRAGEGPVGFAGGVTESPQKVAMVFDGFLKGLRWFFYGFSMGFH